MTNIGPYEVVREIGRGGMGVVSLARDTRLDRDVAIKALPEELASDPGRLERFEREARTLASLSHPNVAGIYGVEEQGGSRYLILEYVEGETLAERLDRGPLAVEDAVEVAVEIARGLEAAHEAGVIHRDLKPANIKITPEGQVKVLDFGLAKADEGLSSSGSGLSQSPTLTSPVPQHSPTIPGAILGTAAYMSPEQARGRRVDKRTDIWAFGVILYEMLTGASPFVGETATDSIGAVLHKELDLAGLPAGTPAGVHRVLARCVERDRDLRYRDIGDVRVELTGAVAEAAVVTAPAAGRIPVGLVVAVAVIVGLVVAGGGWWFGRSSAPAGAVGAPEAAMARPLTVEVAAPEGYLIARRAGRPSLSPDGMKLAMVVEPREADGERLGERPAYLCVVDLGSGEVMVDTRRASVTEPVWSPDGRSIAFADQVSTVYRYDLATGQASPVFVSSDGPTRSLEWFPDGSVWTVIGRRQLRRIDLATGDVGQPVDLGAVDASGGGFPVWLTAIPDGRAFVFTHISGGSSDGVYLCDRPSGEVTRVLSVVETQTRYLPSGTPGVGWLYFSRDRAIFRQALDVAGAALIGEPELVADGAWEGEWPYFAPFDVGKDGRLVYFTASERDAENELVLFDVERGEAKPTGQTGSFWNPMYSSDDRYVLLDITSDATSGDIYSIDLSRGYLRTNISAEPVNETFPVWIGSDDDLLAFFRDGDIYLADHGGLARPRVILEGPASYRPISTTPDGATLFYGETTASGERTLRLYDFATGESRRWLDIDYRQIRVAPNGSWALILTGRPGQDQLELRRYPEGDGRVVLDSGGLWGAEWSGDGSKLFYVLGDHLVARSVTWRDDGSAPEFGDPVPVVSMEHYREYDVNSDGTELLLIEVFDEEPGGSVRLVTSDVPPGLPRTGR